MPRDAQKQNTQSAGVQAPIRGIIATGIYEGSGSDSGGNSAEGDTGVDSAIWLFNMIPGEYGCRVRPGSRNLVTDVPDSIGPSGQIRSVFYFNSVIAGGTFDVTFAITDEGIYDVSAGGPGPWVLGDRPADLVWPIQGGNAGWASNVNFTNVAGDHFLLIADEVNGYYIFDGTTWAQGTFTGNPIPDAENLVHITEWNGRIWFAEKNSARAWFLDPLALAGGITPMDVGNRFKEGGHLVQNSTWTLDAGDGMDDKFVMISSTGDVLVWEGLDPTTADDLIMVGRWQVGGVPEGRRLLSDWGGDVMILSTSGLITVSALLEGTSTLNQRKFISRNINQYIRAEMSKTILEFGWSMELVPNEGIAIFIIPQPLNSSRAAIQFVMETGSNSWCMFRDLKIMATAKADHIMLFSTFDGRIMVLDGTLDNVSLDGLTGEAITFSMLTHYSGMGSPASWKRGQFIRPYWIGAVQPVFSIKVLWDFDLRELPTTPAYTPDDLATWDAAIWDLDVWVGSAQSYLETIGIGGMGRHAAIAIRGNSVNDLTYIGADVMFDKGGML